MHDLRNDGFGEQKETARDKFEQAAVCVFVLALVPVVLVTAVVTATLGFVADTINLRGK